MGQPESLLQTVIDNTQITSGAKTLIATMRAHGATCYLVSGGFTFLTSFVEHWAFAIILRTSLGSAMAHLPARLSPLPDKTPKTILQQQADMLGISVADAICVGDGANDGEMLSTAGRGCV